MQVFVSFPDAGYPDVVFEATGESLVSDAIQAAANEWGADAEFLELSLCGSLIPRNSLLMSHGVEADTQLTASLLQVFGCEWFTDYGIRKKLMLHLSKIEEKHLFLDTPSFATDGHFQFDMAWIPYDIEISFINPHPSITSAECLMPSYIDEEEFPVAKVDLSGLKSITSVGDHFLSVCSSIKTLDVSCLSNVTEIGRCFLNGCSSLKSLDLGSFNNVTAIGDWFLGDCSSLKSLDITPLNNVTKIGTDFLKNCVSLTRVKGLSPESEVRMAIERTNRTFLSD